MARTDRTASGPRAPSESFDLELVRSLAKVLDETGLTEVEVERGGMRVRVARGAAAAAGVATLVAPPAAATATAAQGAEPRDHGRGEVIRSPMVGTVYFQSQPGAEPFARVGDSLAEGQTLLLVEAMKTMNPIAAPRAGRLIEVLVSDGQPVEYGEPLLVIE